MRSFTFGHVRQLDKAAEHVPLHGVLAGSGTNPSVMATSRAAAEHRPSSALESAAGSRHMLRRRCRRWCIPPRRTSTAGTTLAHQHSRGPLPTHSFGRSCPVKLHIALRSPLRRAVSSLRRSTEKALAELATGRPRWSLKRRWFAARACCATSNSSCLTRQCPSAIQCAAHGTVVAQLLHHDARATRRHCRRDWRLGLAESRRCSPQQT